MTTSEEQESEAVWAALRGSSTAPEPGTVEDPHLGLTKEEFPEPASEDDLEAGNREALERHGDDDAPQRKVLSLRTGNEVSYARPPRATTRVRWSKNTTGGKPVTGSFRHICHLNLLNRRAQARFGCEIEIIQSAYNTTVAASKGTHDFDAVVDLYIPGVDWWRQQRFFRRNGLGSWYRHPPKFGYHIHGFTLPPREGASISDDYAVHGLKVGIYVPGQLYDYYKHAFGLKDMHTPGSDKSWYPRDIEATIFDLRAYVARQKALQA